MKNTISDRLKTLRDNSSGAAFAKNIGISQSAFSKYELGQSEPGADCIRKICIGCNCSADWLLGLSDERVNIGNHSPNSTFLNTNCQIDNAGQSALIEQMRAEIVELRAQNERLLNIIDTLSGRT